MRRGEGAVSARLSIYDSADGVQFRVRGERSVSTVLWNLFLCVFLVLFGTGIVTDRWPWQRIFLVVVGGLGIGAFVSRERRITTTFSREGVTVHGAFAIGFHAPRWTPLQEISGLLWQPTWDGGPEASYLPAGLYAQRGLRAVCLIPYIDAMHAQEAIRAIERRFSWVERDNRSSNTLLFTDDLVRLGLDT